MSKREFSIRKRQAISKSQHTMFLIVAAAAAFMGICLVSSWFLVSRMLFNFRVISEQNKTIANLSTNYKNIKSIEEQIRVLGTNEALLKKRIYPAETALQVVIDALPDRANTLALGESLRRNLLTGGGAEIDQLSMTKTDDETSSEFAGMSTVAYNQEYSDVKEPSIYFRAKIIGTSNALAQVLRNLENSIRPMFVDNMEIQSNSSGRDSSGRIVSEADQKHTLVLSARSFYSPSVEPTMTTKLIKEGGKR